MLPPSSLADTGGNIRPAEKTLDFTNKQRVYCNNKNMYQAWNRSRKIHIIRESLGLTKITDLP